jgi:hypothetical protein
MEQLPCARCSCVTRSKAARRCLCSGLRWRARRHRCTVSSRAPGHLGSWKLSGVSLRYAAGGVGVPRSRLLLASQRPASSLTVGRTYTLRELSKLAGARERVQRRFRRRARRYSIATSIATSGLNQSPRGGGRGNCQGHRRLDRRSYSVKRGPGLIGFATERRSASPRPEPSIAMTPSPSNHTKPGASLLPG